MEGSDYVKNARFLGNSDDLVEMIDRFTIILSDISSVNSSER